MQTSRRYFRLSALPSVSVYSITDTNRGIGEYKLELSFDSVKLAETFRDSHCESRDKICVDHDTLGRSQKLRMD